jgi:hypothetical protein
MGEGRQVRTYCPISFALKLALFCLLAGLAAGVWLSAAVLSTSDSLPREPSTQVTDGSPGSTGGEDW